MRRFVSIIFVFALVVAACGDDAVDTTAPGETPGGVAPTQPTEAPGETTAPTDAPPASGGPLYDDWARLGEASRSIDAYEAVSAEAWALVPDTVPVEEAWDLGGGIAWAVDGCHAGFQVTKMTAREIDEPPYVLRDDYDDVVAWLIAEAEAAGWSVTTSEWVPAVVVDGYEAEGTVLHLTGPGEPWQLQVITSQHSTDVGYCPAG